MPQRVGFVLYEVVATSPNVRGRRGHDWSHRGVLSPRVVRPSTHPANPHLNPSASLRTRCGAPAFLADQMWATRQVRFLKDRHCSTPPPKAAFPYVNAGFPTDSAQPPISQMHNTFPQSATRFPCSSLRGVECHSSSGAKHRPHCGNHCKQLYILDSDNGQVKL